MHLVEVHDNSEAVVEGPCLHPQPQQPSDQLPLLQNLPLQSLHFVLFLFFLWLHHVLLPLSWLLLLFHLHLLQGPRNTHEQFFHHVAASPVVQEVVLVDRLDAPSAEDGVTHRTG